MHFSRFLPCISPSIPILLAWPGNPQQVRFCKLATGGGSAVLQHQVTILDAWSRPVALDSSTEWHVTAKSKMKVHPAMLMKTNKSRFQVSGARCQGSVSI